MSVAVPPVVVIVVRRVGDCPCRVPVREEVAEELAQLPVVEVEERRPEGAHRPIQTANVAGVDAVRLGLLQHAVYHLPRKERKQLLDRREVFLPLEVLMFVFLLRHEPSLQWVSRGSRGSILAPSTATG
jgi:hypothetical protein